MQKIIGALYSFSIRLIRIWLGEFILRRIKSLSFIFANRIRLASLSVPCPQVLVTAVQAVKEEKIYSQNLGSKGIQS